MRRNRNESEDGCNRNRSENGCKPGIERLRSGEPVAAGWLSIVEPAIAEITASVGYEVVFLDMEHNTASLKDVEHGMRGLETGGNPGTVVRVPSDDPVYLKQVLDIGVDGVMVPMVETPAEAETLVEATRYPPDGKRGTGVWRAQEYGERLVEYVKSADESLLRVAQLETPTAVDNAAEIAEVDGIDSLFVGPIDLSTALGNPGDTRSDAFFEAIETIIDAAHDRDKPVGVLALDYEDVVYYDDLGFDWQIVGVDLLAFRKGLASARVTHRDVVGE